MEEEAKAILSAHGCSFIAMLSECRVLWKNQVGTVQSDDIFVLRNMSESAWNFWAVA